MDPSDLSSLNGVLLEDLNNPMKMSDAGECSTGEFCSTDLGLCMYRNLQRH
jgi:hypothetical protein